MLNFFKKKSGKKFEIKASVKGKVIPITEVPDEVFSGKMLGDGFAVDPSEGILYAPVEGEIVQIFPTKHAVGIRTEEGLEILLHIGIDTVSMAGEGFEGHVSQGDRVKEGQKLVSFNIDLIKEKAKSAITVVVVTNMDLVDKIDFNYGSADMNTAAAIVTLK